MDPARRAAYDLLHAVGAEHAYANLALPRILRERRLAGRDAAFATELAYGTLRWQGLHDAVLGACLDRPLSRVDPPVRDVLRLGVHQLLLLRVPVHAAVAETVALARAVSNEGAAGLVNAVLRQAAVQDRRSWVAQVAPSDEVDRAAHLAVAWSHPRWIVTALREALGGSWDATTRLLQVDNEAARPTLVARPARIDPATVLDLPGVRPGRWSPFAAALDSGPPEALAEVRDGRVGVQDEGSQLVTLALTRSVVSGVDDTWVDLCAGPGGKAALLADLLAVRSTPGEPGELVAVEPQPHRAALVEQALHGSPGRHRVVVADGRASGVAEGTVDRVLVDVPCTGLGVLRRRPEARWRRSPGDVAALAPLQRELLAAALRLVRPGGVVGYVTCSPHLAETDVVVEEVLAGRVDVVWEDARPLLPEVPDLGPGPAVRLWPHLHGTDGMYLAVLRRTR